MNDRGIERIDAVLIYNDQSRAAGDRIKGSDTSASIAAGLNADKDMPGALSRLPGGLSEGVQRAACARQLSFGR